MSPRSGPRDSSAGVMPEPPRAQHAAPARPTSASWCPCAIDRTSAIGRLVNSATDATGPRDAMARSGTIAVGDRRAGIRSTESGRDRSRPHAAAARTRTARRSGRRTADDARDRRRADGRSDSPRRRGEPGSSRGMDRSGRCARPAPSPAARMFRRISSSGARRRPSVVSSSGETPSTSSAPTVSATCASLGP